MFLENKNALRTQEVVCGENLKNCSATRSGTHSADLQHTG